ncbi:hypothetical protein E2C01_032966 [Portunus trituberculatus]|uniref:Uncharacterized protein n=1 Tax=Portunus trituberculatus TaxID=210409 RepID=A0A5B7EWK8_PORTR|nr:hypothetical protein [Portunus trituberculatus]
MPRQDRQTADIQGQRRWEVERDASQAGGEVASGGRGCARREAGRRRAWGRSAHSPDRYWSATPDPVTSDLLTLTYVTYKACNEVGSCICLVHSLYA